MHSAFQKHIDNKLHFLKEGRCLIAISGGLDSVVLTHLCHEIGLNIALAHCNFNLREIESDHDEQFVLKLAEQLDVEAFVERFNTEFYANENKLSIQMAARDLRYNWFYDLAEQLQFDYILTAHHADDNLETFLINLSRGTGIDGLVGIPEVNESIVRPLLKFSRQEIEDYAKNNNLKWREDSSNASTKYLRNKLRHNIIPVLKAINPYFLDNFQKTVSHLKDSNSIIDDSLNSLISNGVVSPTADGLKISIELLKQFDNPKGYLYLILHSYGFTEWNDVTDLMNAQTGKFLTAKNWRLLKDRELLILSETSETENRSISISESDNEIEMPLGTLFFDEADALFGKQSEVIYVDRDKLNYPLTLRQWKDGDYFYPIGMNGKKKLSKYFKDEKLSLIDKENVWLLCSNDDIVWVINRRADNRFKIEDQAKHILKIELR